MEASKIKCSSKKHKENDAINYCQECKLYLCNKCENLHSELFENHQLHKIDINISNMFTGYCTVENHLEKLEFFCKNHNELCCSSCITKLKGKKYGQHGNCEICFIENIKDEKINKLKENIQNLEELSNNLNDSINKLKNIFVKINEEKEQIKLKIQNIFTKIRNTLNDREDKLLLKVDEIFNDSYMKEEDINKIIKKGEKLPYEIQLSLEKGKNIEKQLNDEDNKLISLINDCLNIENNIKNMNRINENIKMCGSEQLEIKFIPEKDEEINFF